MWDGTHRCIADQYLKFYVISLKTHGSSKCTNMCKKHTQLQIKNSPWHCPLPKPSWILHNDLLWLTQKETTKKAIRLVFRAPIRAHTGRLFKLADVVHVKNLYSVDSIKHTVHLAFHGLFFLIYSTFNRDFLKLLLKTVSLIEQYA